MLDHIVSRLTTPYQIYGRSDVVSKPRPIPASRGIYAWFFRNIPSGIPTNDCKKFNELTLLYVGISPSRATSANNLQRRIRYHYCGNASGSTLRLSLGVLLTPISSFPLRRVGSGRRMTFTHLGEQWLDDWMEQNAFVAWMEHPEPWAVEAGVISRLSLPLNIQDNRNHPFSVELRKHRRQAMDLARSSAVATEGNQARLGGLARLGDRHRKTK